VDTQGNCEWVDRYGGHFRLVYVDFDPLEGIPKPSATGFREAEHIRLTSCNRCAAELQVPWSSFPAGLTGA
jgi:hypothetical protein